MRPTLNLYISHINNIKEVPFYSINQNKDLSESNVLIINIINETFTIARFPKNNRNYFTLKNKAIYNINDLPTYYSDHWIILTDSSCIEKKFNSLEIFFKNFILNICYLDVNLIDSFNNTTFKNATIKHNYLEDLVAYLNKENSYQNVDFHEKNYTPKPVDASWNFVTYKLCKDLLKPREIHGHKGVFGHGLIIGGSAAMMGAVYFSSKSTIRSGCGLVSVIVPEKQSPIIQIKLPEAMVFGNIENLAYKIPDNLHEKIDSIGIGPGMGQDRNAQKCLINVLNTTTLPLVIDADGLNLLNTINKWEEKTKGRAILTPHIVEFDRLFGIFPNTFERIHFAKEFTAKYDIVIVLKGAYTFIVSKGKIYVNSTGNNGMSTGGSGDVLTGILTSLLAQGYTLVDAATLGVFLHGLSGDIALENFSEESVIASDLINHIPKAFIQLKAFES